MLYRKAEGELRRWLASGTTPLLVDGAPKVGKTSLIRKVLKETGTDYVEFRLSEQPRLERLLLGSHTAEDMLASFRLFTGNPLEDPNTVIFLDDIEEYHSLAAVFILMIQKGRSRFLFSGCFSETVLRQIAKMAQRDLHILRLYPMDFEEFLQIYQFTPEQKEILFRSFLEKKPVHEALHLRMMHLFHTYLNIGGMPEAVSVFQETRSLAETMKVQEAINLHYHSLFHRQNRILKKHYLSEIYDLIPMELDQHNKRFHFSDIDRGLRFDRNGRNFVCLCDMKLALPVFHITGLAHPLDEVGKDSLFKLFLFDVGLLTAQYGMETKELLDSDATNVRNGAIYENAVAQELTAHGFRLFYFSNKQHGELDFVTEFRKEVLPIQVKLGKKYHRHSALIHVQNISGGEVAESILFYDKNVRAEKNVTRYPIYMLMFLHANEEAGRNS